MANDQQYYGTSDPFIQNIQSKCKWRTWQRLK